MVIAADIYVVFYILLFLIFEIFFFKMYLLEAKNLSKTYKEVNEEHLIFQNLNLTISTGESILLLGNSGCGKSTLLQILGLIQKPTSGEIFIEEANCSEINEKQKNELLKQKIGFIYQFHYLFNDFTALENLIIPQLIKHIDRTKAEQNALEMLEKLKMSHRKNAMPFELSGGERQRVAIARAIIKQPKLILADEPTGNLDNDMSNFVVDEMLKMVKDENIALLMVSHNREFSKKFDRTYELSSNGLIEK